MWSIWDNLLVRFSVVSLVALAAVAVSIAVFVSDRIGRDAIDEVCWQPAQMGQIGTREIRGVEELG